MKNSSLNPNPLREVVIALFSAVVGGLVTWFALSLSRESSAPQTTGATPPAQMGPVAAGNWYYDQRLWPEAMASFEKALASGIDNPDVRTDLGNVYRFTGQPQKALEQYAIAQRQNPNHENSLFNQGALYSQDLKEPERAAAIWKEYLRRFPKGQAADMARKLLGQQQAGALPSSTQEAVADYLKQLPR